MPTRSEKPNGLYVLLYLAALAVISILWFGDSRPALQSDLGHTLLVMLFGCACLAVGKSLPVGLLALTPLCVFAAIYYWLQDFSRLSLTYICAGVLSVLAAGVVWFLNRRLSHSRHLRLLPPPDEN